MSWSEVAEPRPDEGPLQPRRRSIDGQLLGLLLLGFGLAALLRESGVVHLKWEAILAGLLVLLGVGMVLTPRSGRRVWPVPLGIALILVLAAQSPSLHFDLPAGSGLGDQVVRVQESLAPPEASYSHGVGHFTLDLRQVSLEPAYITINQGVGDVTILVPNGVDVVLDADVGIGEATVRHHRLGRGVGVKARYQTHDYPTPGGPLITLTVHVGIGRVEVR